MQIVLALIGILVLLGLVALGYVILSTKNREETKPEAPAPEKPKLEAIPYDGKVKLIANIDQIVAAPIPFLCDGMVHYLKPIEVQQFLVTAEQMALLFDRINGKSGSVKMTFEEMIDHYYGLISTVCDSISKEDLKRMPMAKVRGLLQLVYDHITGRLTDEKKSPVIAPASSQKTQPSS